MIIISRQYSPKERMPFEKKTAKERAKKKNMAVTIWRAGWLIASLSRAYVIDIVLRGVL